MDVVLLVYPKRCGDEIPFSISCGVNCANITRGFKFFATFWISYCPAQNPRSLNMFYNIKTTIERYLFNICLISMF